MENQDYETTRPPAHAAPPAPDVSDALPQAAPGKRHRIYDHRVLTIFVNFFFFLVIGNLISTVIVLAVLLLDMMGIVSVTISAGDTVLGQTNLITSVSSILVGILLLFIYESRVKGEQKSVAIWSTTGMLLVLPGLAFVAVNLLEVRPEDLAAMNPVLYCLVMALAPGIAEEVAFRGTSGSNWMRVRGEARDIIPGCLVTALVFGLVHGLNALAGAPLSTTAFQVYYAFCLGVLFDAVLLRSGSIIPCIIMHTLIDFSAFLFMDLSQGGILTEELTIDLSFFVTLIAATGLLVSGLYLLRPSKHDEIVALWNEKCYRS